MDVVKELSCQSKEQIANQRVSVKKSVGRLRASPYETSLAFLLPSPYPEQVKSDWQCVRKTPKKKARFNEIEKKYKKEKFNLMIGLF